MEPIERGFHPTRYRDPKTGRFRVHPNSMFSPEGQERWRRALAELPLGELGAELTNADVLAAWLGEP